jgi:hypothetical protein
MTREVHLYVSTTRYQNITTSVVNNFFQTVTNAGGVCESGQCMIDYLNSLGGLFGNYENSERLELFNDETINLTSTVQNVQDISKTFTDFSQSFTIPANDHNNQILQHFYQSDVNALFDYNLRLDSFIEIDLTFFRRGKLQVEKANLKNGRPESYTVTFYGDGRTLKDYFGEDLLSDLDYTAYNHTYTGTEVQNRITDATNQYDVKYPLISSKRIWHYQSNYVNATSPNWLDITAISQNDIHASSGAVKYDELFPALRVRAIFDLIQAKYGVTFEGTFLTDDRFTKLFLYYKNKSEFEVIGKQNLVNIESVSPPSGIYDLSSSFDITADTITFTEINGVLTHILSIDILTMSVLVPTFIDVYQNGNLLNSIEFSNVGNYTLDVVNQSSGMNISYQVYLRPTQAVNITHSLNYAVNYLSGSSLITESQSTTNAATSMIMTQSLEYNAPQMKISDFFTGILKTFNMVCVSSDVNVYDIEPLDAWYGQGAIVDITEDTDIASIDVARMPLYKKISFKFTDSEAFLNKQFNQMFSRGYGDMTYQYDYDGGEYTIELPFENLLQQKFTGTNLQVGYALNNEFAPYTPKPILLYQYDNQDCNFKFDRGSIVTITNYTPFGQDLYYNNTDLTLNFAPETSTLLEYPIQNTVFAQYYFSYLYNLYNLKQRLVTVKTTLPVGVLTNLKLNDRLIIRDKRYIINDMNTNLTTGEVQFSLYLDFRPMINKVPFINIPAGGGSAVTAINIPNGGITALLTPSAADIVLSQTTLTASQNVTITTGPLTSGSAYSIDAAFTYTDGTRTNDNIFIVIE